MLIPLIRIVAMAGTLVLLDTAALPAQRGPAVVVVTAVIEREVTAGRYAFTDISRQDPCHQHDHGRSAADQGGHARACHIAHRPSYNCTACSQGRTGT